MKIQHCPNCGETNPLEAVMCWACYTALREPERPSVIRKGMFRRLAIRMFPLFSKKQEGEDPIVLILDTIIDYALMDKASEIHIEPQKVNRPREATPAQLEAWRKVFDAGLGVLKSIPKMGQGAQSAPSSMLDVRC